MAPADRARLDALLQLAQAHWSRAAGADAAQALDAARALAHDDAQAWARLGDVCSRLEHYARALAAYDRAIELAPRHAGLWFNRAAVRRFLGQLDAAESDYDRCLELDPTDARACLNRADLRVQSPERNHVEQLQRRLALAGDWRHAVPLHYALAKELEDLGRTAESWRSLAAGAALRRRHLAYDPRTDLATFSWLAEAFPGARELPGDGDPSSAPIFILGMPRTGSSLLDRLIGSHSRVHSAGELLHMGNAITEAARRRLDASAGATAPERSALIRASAALDFAALGSNYLARARAQSGARAHFVDKLPLNFLYCPHIARALPNARIVHVTRHPLATCYGIFKVLFDQGYPFSYDLAELADYYIGYYRLMQHWRTTLPQRLLEVSYEALVRDPAGQMRRVLAALDLPWEDACLDHRRNPAPIATASASQVRRPIYTSAVDSWRRCAAQLEPVRQRLVAAGIVCD